jgi:hypothetical protein
MRSRRRPEFRRARAWDQRCMSLALLFILTGSLVAAAAIAVAYALARG